MNGNFKTVNLDELEDKIEENIALLNATTSELKKIEDVLKRGLIKPFEVKIDERLTFYWNKDDRRLCMIFDGVDRRCLEHKIDARVYAFDFLEKFVSELKNKI